MNFSNIVEMSKTLNVPGGHETTPQCTIVPLWHLQCACKIAGEVVGQEGTTLVPRSNAQSKVRKGFSRGVFSGGKPILLHRVIARVMQATDDRAYSRPLNPRVRKATGNLRWIIQVFPLTIYGVPVFGFKKYNALPNAIAETICVWMSRLGRSCCEIPFEFCQGTALSLKLPQTRAFRRLCR